ncbi:membrane hypothetical protein [Vibrio chagasii]|nr:membrane hypothetical protein [Vibrio chagasii]
MSTQDIQNTQETKVSSDLPVRYTDQKKRTAKSKRRLFYLFIITCMVMHFTPLYTGSFHTTFDGSVIHAMSEPFIAAIALFLLIVSRGMANRVQIGTYQIITDYADGTSTVATYKDYHYYNAEERIEVRMAHNGISGYLIMNTLITQFWALTVVTGEFIGDGVDLGADGMVDIAVRLIILVACTITFTNLLMKIAGKLNKNTSVFEGCMVDPEHGGFEARTLGTIGTTLLWVLCVITFGMMFHQLLPAMVFEYIPYLINQFM